jgi:hypothetical protein
MLNCVQCNIHKSSLLYNINCTLNNDDMDMEDIYIIHFNNSAQKKSLFELFSKPILNNEILLYYTWSNAS